MDKDFNKYAEVMNGIFYSLTKESMGDMPSGPDAADQSAAGGAGIPGSMGDVSGTSTGNSFGITDNADAFTMGTTM